MTDVFISYTSNDRERARRLATALAARGWSVWWDRKIKAGQIFDEVIERELETAKTIVVLWSNDSISSEWVKNEAAVAAQRGILVPVLMDSVKLPLEFRRKQTVDLIGWDGSSSHDGFQALCEALEGMIPGSEAVPYQSPTLSDRRFRWNRTWTLGCVAAIVIASVGAYIVLHDSQEVVREHQTPLTVSPTPKAEHSSVPEQRRSKEVLPSDLQSSYKGVFVDVASFERRGELVTLEVQFRNTSDRQVQVCSGASRATLIDEFTGESWEAVHYGGSVRGCSSIDSGESGGAWMKFKIRDPEKRKFSLSLPMLNQTPGLVLEQR